MEAVETRRKQGSISVSKKAASRAASYGTQQAQSEYFRDINTVIETRFLKWLGKSKISIKM